MYIRLTTTALIKNEAEIQKWKTLGAGEVKRASWVNMNKISGVQWTRVDFRARHLYIPPCSFMEIRTNQDSIMWFIKTSSSLLRLVIEVQVKTFFHGFSSVIVPKVHLHIATNEWIQPSYWSKSSDELSADVLRTEEDGELKLPDLLSWQPLCLLLLVTLDTSTHSFLGASDWSAQLLIMSNRINWDCLLISDQGSDNMSINWSPSWKLMENM